MTQTSTRKVAGVTYERIPIRTHHVGIGEELGGVIATYAAEQIQPPDSICLSGKLVSICQGNVRHMDDVKESWLARLIAARVSKNGETAGYSHPKKVQVAIDDAGYPRVILAVVGGGLSKYVLRRRGDFYRLVGHRVAGIEGFRADAMAPWDKYAKLPPRQPDSVCEDVAARLGCAAYIIEGNNVDVQVVGTSANLPMTRASAREVMLDNPMGQDEELTPIFLIRPVQGAAA